MAVCSGKITCAAYNDAVQGALRMIRYGKKDIVRQLREKMEAASERLDFETAALLRDQIMAIDRVAAGQKVVMERDTEMDVIALAGTTHAVCAAVPQPASSSAQNRRVERIVRCFMGRHPF